MRSDQLLLPTASITSTRASFVPSIFRDLRLALSLGLLLEKRDWGTLRFMAQRIRFGGLLGFARGVFFHALPIMPCL